MEKKIIVLDFGSQYNQLITRRIRSLGVYSELVSNTITAQKIKEDKSIIGIVFSGGPNSAYEKDSPQVDKEIYKLGLPILGICYGAQLICHMNNGKVIACNKKEYGSTDITITKHCKLTKGLSDKELVWMSHGDQVEVLPAGFEKNANSDTCKYAMFSNPEQNIYAIQFHPEVVHTKNGMQILKNFLFEICKAEPTWKVENFVNDKITEIKAKVGNDQVLCALSGGVDSSVTAAIIDKAIGDKLTCFFVDHGLLRKNEAQMVIDMFKKNFKAKLVVKDAKQLFLSKLKGVTDPEQKRKIIGKLFIDIFDEYSQAQDNIKYLAQGTLYTDIIESGTKTAQTIKSHHNVGGLPKDMKFKLIEPLNNLYKDEVRALGTELGLPNEVVQRQPFPGPGLGIRIIGEVNEEAIRLVQDSDAILREEIVKNGLDKEIWQYFTVLPNVKVVGVKGDQRSYENVIVIRAVSSIDGMTADYAKIPYEVLDKISNRITNEVKGINRVVYDITSKPPGTIEWE